MQRKKASSDKAPSKQTQPRPRRNFVGDPALALGIGVRIVKGLEENGGRKSHATRLLKNDQKLKEVLEVLMRDDKLNPLCLAVAEAFFRRRKEIMLGRSLAEAAQACGDKPADPPKPRARQKRRTK